MAVWRTRVNLAFAAGEGVGTNTWTVRTVSDTGSTSQIATLMGGVQSFYTAIQATFPTNSTFTWDGTAQQLGVPDPQLITPASPWTVTGTGAASTYGPAPAMICVTWRSSLANRRGRGRTFLGPLIPGAFQADGSLATATLGGFRTAAANLVTFSTSSAVAGALAVWSETDQVARDFIASSVTDQVAVLRSRR
jgi:hypothetical protein